MFCPALSCRTLVRKVMKEAFQEEESGQTEPALGTQSREVPTAPTPAPVLEAPKPSVSVVRNIFRDGWLNLSFVVDSAPSSMLKIMRIFLNVFVPVGMLFLSWGPVLHCCSLKALLYMCSLTALAPSHSLSFSHRCCRRSCRCSPAHGKQHCLSLDCCCWHCWCSLCTSMRKPCVPCQSRLHSLQLHSRVLHGNSRRAPRDRDFCAEWLWEMRYFVLLVGGSIVYT